MDGDAGISAEELNFDKFIISLQQRFALGILDGLTTHLKLKGIWDLYKLNRSKLDVVFTPPIEYEQYRKQKKLESKITELKLVLGEQGINTLFSEEYALTYLMGWDKNTIQENSEQKFKERVKHAQQDAFIQKIKETGTIDITMDGLWDQSLKDILQEDLEDENSLNSQNSDQNSETSDDNSMEEDEFSEAETDNDQTGGIEL